MEELKSFNTFTYIYIALVICMIISVLLGFFKGIIKYICSDKLVTTAHGAFTLGKGFFSRFPNSLKFSIMYNSNNLDETWHTKEIDIYMKE